MAQKIDYVNFQWDCNTARIAKQVPINAAYKPYKLEDAAKEAWRDPSIPKENREQPCYLDSCDAYRHCVGSCRISQKYGDLVSDWAGKLHEIGPSPTGGEEDMDLNNNICGRYGTVEDCEDRCKEMLQNGMLTTVEPWHEGLGLYGR
jgi:hypothetical protein